MSSYKTIIFDLSDTLLDFEPNIGKDLARRLNEPLEIIYQSFENDYLYDYYLGRTTEVEYLNAIMKDWPSDIGLAEMKAIIRRNLEIQMPGMPALLKALKPHYELALLSDHSIEWVDHILNNHPFLEIIERKFFSFDLGSTKSEPATFRNVLEMLGRAPGECLFIDDQPHNCDIALSVGIDAIRFVSADDLKPELRKRGVAGC